jgi:hypothetical protein
MAMFQINLRPGKRFENAAVGEEPMKKISQKKRNFYLYVLYLQLYYWCKMNFPCS